MSHTYINTCAPTYIHTYMHTHRLKAAAARQADRANGLQRANNGLAAKQKSLRNQVNQLGRAADRTRNDLGDMRDRCVLCCVSTVCMCMMIPLT